MPLFYFIIIDLLPFTYDYAYAHAYAYAFQGKIFFTKNVQGKYSLHKNISFFSFLNTYKFFNMQRRHLKKTFFIKKTFFHKFFFFFFIKKIYFFTYLICKDDIIKCTCKDDILIFQFLYPDIFKQRHAVSMTHFV